MMFCTYKLQERETRAYSWKSVFSYNPNQFYIRTKSKEWGKNPWIPTLKEIFV